MKNKDRELEKKVDRTLESIDHIQRVEANPYLWSKIQEQLEAPPGTTGFVKKWPQAYALQTSMAFLLILGLFNVFTLINYSNRSVENEEGFSSITAIYGWSESTDMGIYEGLWSE